MEAAGRGGKIEHMRTLTDAVRQFSICALMATAVMPALAADKAPDLPDLDAFRERLADQPAPRTAAGRPVAAAMTPGECDLPSPRLDFTIRSKALSLKRVYFIKSRGEDFGRIVERSKGYQLLGAEGRPIAEAAVEGLGRGQRVSMTDACGRKIGEVLRIDEGSDGAHSFRILDAGGAILAVSKTAGYGQSEMSLTDAAGKALVRFDLHKDYIRRDIWQVQGEAAHSGRGARLDWRLSAAVLLSHLEADRDRTRELQREDRILLYP